MRYFEKQSASLLDKVRILINPELAGVGHIGRVARKGAAIGAGVHGGLSAALAGAAYGPVGAVAGGGLGAVQGAISGGALGALFGIGAKRRAIAAAQQQQANALLGLGAAGVLGGGTYLAVKKK